MPRLTAERARLALAAAGGNATRAAKALGIEREELAAMLPEVPPLGPPRRWVLTDRERAAIEEHGSVNAAARALGISPSGLRYRVNGGSRTAPPTGTKEKRHKRTKKG